MHKKKKTPVSIPSSDAPANLDTRIRGIAFLNTIATTSSTCHRTFVRVPGRILVASLTALLVGSLLGVEVLIIRFHFNIFRSRRVEIFSIEIHLVVFGQVGVSIAVAAEAVI